MALNAIHHLKDSLNTNTTISEKNDSINLQPLYDVPRSNPRRVSPTRLLTQANDEIINSAPLDFTAEAIYVNDSYSNDIVSVVVNSVEEEQALDQYDVPRNNKTLRDFIPQDYDVPKNRDSLSTIEEEHQEYDIPKPLLDAYTEKKYEEASSTQERKEKEDIGLDNSSRGKIIADDKNVISNRFESNLYENQQEIFKNDSNENIYVNEDSVLNTVGGGSTNLCNSHRYKSSYYRIKILSLKW